MERQNLHTTTVDIQAMHAKYKQTREPVPDGQHTKFVYNTQPEKDKFKKMSQEEDTTLQFTQTFFKTPVHLWRIWKWKYLCDFLYQNSINLSNLCRVLQAHLPCQA